MGNLKLDAPALPVDEPMLDSIKTTIGDRPVWLTASTHSGEDELVLKAHKNLVKEFTNLLTIIVPRHPARGLAIAELAKNNELNCTVRSRGEKPEKDIYIADTMGELGLWYRLVSIAFIGGSMVPHGGQNMLEAARLNCAIIHGPHTYNFAALTEEMHIYKSCLRVENTAQLTDTVRDLLQNNRKRETLANAAMEFAAAQTGALENTFLALSPYLKEMSDAHS